MDFFEVVKKRRSIREYTGESITNEDLEKIIDAARHAASGYNAQPWKFVLVTDREKIKAISQMMSPWMEKSAAMMAVLVNPEAHFAVQDCSAATQNILLAATALGYGSCWLEGTSSRYERALKNLLRIPDALRLQTLISIGVPTQIPEREKKPLSEVLCWQEYSD